MRALFMMAEMVDQPFDQQREQLDGDHDEDQGESSASPMGQGGKAVRERGLEPEGGGFASRPRRMATASAIRRGAGDPSKPPSVIRWSVSIDAWVAYLTECFYVYYVPQLSRSCALHAAKRDSLTEQNGGLTEK